MVSADLSFSNIVKELQVDEIAWLMDELTLPSPQKNYVIIFTARSGSSWLTNVLSETRQLGFPEEYLNPSFVRGVAKAVNSTVPEEFIAGLQRRRQSPNGVFGLEARALDIEAFGAACFYATIGRNAVFFNLWRSNIVAQAVSLFRAVQTQQFHIKEGEAALPPPAYETKGIGHWMIHLTRQENANLEMLQHRRCSFFNLCYEEMVKDRGRTLRLFARELGVELLADTRAGLVEPSLARISDDWNHESEMRFRAEAEKFVTRIEANRKIKSAIPEPAHGELIRPAPAHAGPRTETVDPPLRIVRSGM
jgi:LPS sulfotransferase NodH